MKFTKLALNQSNHPDKATQKVMNNLSNLLSELENREVNALVVETVNAKVNELNSIPDSQIKKTGKKTYRELINLVKKEHGWVPKGYYQTMWIGLGMAVFGVPMGVAFSSSLGNTAFIGIGIPIGMAIGIAIGAGKDKDAAEKGLQLNVKV